jgi:hypothetical protein
MKNYILTLAAFGLIAAAPAYYAFQAQAEESEPRTMGEEVAPADESATTDAATDSATEQEPAAGDTMAGEKPSLANEGANE